MRRLVFEIHVLVNHNLVRRFFLSAEREIELALFPGLPTVQFLIACSMQKQRGKAWSILSRE